MSRPDAWSSPRPYADAAQRHSHYGPLVPMVEPARSYRGTIRLTLLAAAALFAFGLALRAMGGG